MITYLPNNSNKVWDYKYKILDKKNSYDTNDVTKIIRDIIAHNKLTQLIEGDYQGELVYAESIQINSNNIPEFQLEISEINIGTRIINDSELFKNISISYSKLHMFSEKK